MSKRIKFILCFLLVATVFLTACSGSGTYNANANDNTNNNEGQKRDDLNIGLRAEPTTLDPMNAGEIVSYMYVAQIFDTLVKEQSDGTFVPGVAEKWEFLEGGKEILFTLRKDIKFHNGEALTAEDVAFSLNRTIASKFSTKVTSTMEKMEIVDESTVKLILKHPYEPILGCISTGNMGIVSKKAVEADPEGFARNPVGSGPFKFKEWKNGEKIVLERFDDYYRGPAPMKTIVLKIIADPSSAVVALENGEIDILGSPAKSDRKNLMANEKLAYYEVESGYYYHIAFNNEKGIFTNKKLRQAVSYAIDKEALIYGALEGVGVPVECPMPPTSFGYQKDFKNNPYDIEKAKELMAEAGYPDGFKVVLKTIQSPTYLKPTEIVQDQLRAIGIDAEIEILERGAFLSDVYNNCQYEITVWMASTVIPDADFVVYSRFHSSLKGGGNNFMRCDVPELDDLIEKARVSQDKDERMELYRQVSEIVKEEAIMVPLMSGMNGIAANKDLKGVYAHPSLKLDFYNYSW